MTHASARAVNDLSDLVDATRQIAAQTRQRLSEQTPDGTKRRVSLHDPELVTNGVLPTDVVTRIRRRQTRRP